MAQDKASPAFSAGARLERKALRAYLRRLTNSMHGAPEILHTVLDWVLAREKRYGPRKGGL